MSVEDGQKKGRDWSGMAMAGFIITVIAALAVWASGPGTAQGIWGYGVGLLMLATAALIGALASLICLAGVIASVKRRRTARAVHGVVGLAIGLSLAGFLINLVIDAQNYPAIHDVTTNLEDLPQFAIIPPRVYETPYSTEDEWHAQHSEAYGDLMPIQLPTSVAQVVNDAASAAEALGWEIAGMDPQTGRLEATDTTPWFGFKDDVVIRVRPSGSGSIMDLRSVSRVGGGDAGANAKRIRAFIARMSADNS